MDNIAAIRACLQTHAVMPEDGQVRFFKTGKDDYAAHDQFMGVSVPVIRHIAKDFRALSYEQLAILIQSPFNEERLLALIVLVHRYEKTNEQEKVYQFYMNHRQYVNNWNLVDASAHLIVGAHLFKKKKTILVDLAKSPVLWDRRIAILSTWYFIRQDDLEWTFNIAKILLHDEHDLIHKATGWMLREAGNRDENSLKQFLNEYAPVMPRTMLRYAIEKFDERQRKKYLASDQPLHSRAQQ